MASPFIGVRVPQEIYDALQAHIEEKGEKLPKVIVNALQAYLNLPGSAETSLEARVNYIEERLSVLEGQSSHSEKSVKELTHKDVARLTGYAASTIGKYHGENETVANPETGYEFIPRIDGKRRFWITQISEDIS
jgi:hypothetical protein